MTINEKIFKILDEIHMSQAEFARRTGIPVTTVSDWKHTNHVPAADKIMPICKVLGITPEELLMDEEVPPVKVQDYVLQHGDVQLLTEYHDFTYAQQKRLRSYMKRIMKGTDEKKKGKTRENGKDK